MAKIVLAAFGSLGDLHPMLALTIELQRRGHEIVINTLEVYREKIDALGFEFRPLRPNINPDDRELTCELMDAKTGTEKLLKEILIPNIRPMYDDLTEAVRGADLLISGEVVFAAASVAEKTKIKWITTSLAPASFMSAHDPIVPPTAQWLRHFRFLGATFHGGLFSVIRRSIFLPNRIRFVVNFFKKSFVNHVIGNSNQFTACQIAFVKFPSEFLNRLLPSNRADNKSAVLININRRKNVVAASNQIICQQKIFMKAKLLRINIINFVFIFAVNDKHRVWQSIWRALMKSPRHRVKFFLRFYFEQRAFGRIGRFRHRAFRFTRRRRFPRHLPAHVKRQAVSSKQQKN
jgi:UDP:flavonoid glycosyltransferase YjiC (YdhE family)